MKTTIQSNSEAPVGRSLEDFAAACGISRAQLYNIDRALWPENLKIGRKTIAIEDPLAWLRRIREAGGVPSKRRQAEQRA